MTSGAPLNQVVERGGSAGFASGGGAEPNGKTERKRGVSGEAPPALPVEGVLNPEVLSGSEK